MMAGIFWSDKVQYMCSCHNLRPITKVYFCRHCLALRCGDCVSHEVDSHYCPNCLEYMPTPEAKLKKNRCANCFDCPSCTHTLSIRATSVQLPNPDEAGKVTPKKVFYLVCGFCRWSSRDVAIPDQPVATGCWPEPESPHGLRIGCLLDHYRTVVQQEKLERERRKFAPRTGGGSGYLHFDKFGISAVVARKLAGLNPSGKDEDTGAPKEPEPAKASEKAEPLPPWMLIESLNLTSVSSMGQRLVQPEFQPDEVKLLHPRHKSLLIKRSQRCKVCEHNLSKPEYNPSSIKFKIQLTAFYHIVDLRIKTLPVSWQLDQPQRLEITLSNPTTHPTHVSLLPLVEEESKIACSEIELPMSEYLVGPRDDTAEFDDGLSSLVVSEAGMTDSEAVSFHKGNKLGVYVTVTPRASSDGQVRVGLKIKHDFVNVVVQLQGEPQISWLTHAIILNLGQVTLS